MTRIKICGLSRECDIDYVNGAGADFAGFIIDHPESRRSVGITAAAELKAGLSRSIKAVGVFVDKTPGYVARAAKITGLDVIQLHGEEDEEYIKALRSMTGLAVWKAFIIRGKDDLDAAKSSCADLVLLDAGKGAGCAFDWSWLTDFDRPFALAGGLTPENIPDAVKLLRPEIVDISSGVETDGFKDREKIVRAVKAAHSV